MDRLAYISSTIYEYLLFTVLMKRRRPHIHLSLSLLPSYSDTPNLVLCAHYTRIHSYYKRRACSKFSRVRIHTQSQKLTIPPHRPELAGDSARGHTSSLPVIERLCHPSITYPPLLYLQPSALQDTKQASRSHLSEITLSNGKRLVWQRRNHFRNRDYREMGWPPVTRQLRGRAQHYPG